MTNHILADFIQNELGPKLNKDFSYWTSSLRNNSIVGSHQWRNLGQIIIAGCLMAGMNHRSYLEYCAKSGNFALTF